MPLSILILLSLLPSLSSSSSITLPLHRLPPPSQSDPLTHLATLAAASLARAAHLKHPKTTHTPSRAPLSPHSYGGYSIPVSLGTPPQPLPLLLHTGSSLSWVPCTSSYRCNRCSSPSNPIPHLASFLPRSSSSARLAGCRNPKCLFIHPTNSCRPDCTSSNCTQICPPYVVMYGSGSTAGLLMLDTLVLAKSSVGGFTFGCSIYSDRQPSGGLAGFGRGPASLPSQLALSRFAYCLISRRFDDNARESGTLVLNPSATSGVTFTDFATSPDNSTDFYYLPLRHITIGGKKVKIPSTTLVATPGGGGGVIIDSGTTFTYMSKPVFDPVVKAFTNWAIYNRSTEAEGVTGLKPCFVLPDEAEVISMPELVLNFKGGASMLLPVENYFAFAGRSRRTACLAMVSDDGAGDGPAVIIGSFQQQNYYVVYDLEKGRLGFRQQSCLAP